MTLLHGPAAGRAERLGAAEIARQVDDSIARASTLSALAQDALMYDDTAGAEHIAAELRDLLDDDDTDARLHAGEALAIAYLTLDGPQGDRAVETFERLIEIAREAQRGHMVTTWLSNVAFLRLCRTEYEAAVDAARSGLELARGFDDGLIVVHLAYVAIGEAALGRLDPAIEAVSEAAGAALAIDPYIADVLRAGAAVAVAHGQPVLAARLAGASAEQLRREGGDVDAGDRLLLDRTLAAVRRGARQIDVELALRDGAASDPRELLRELPTLLTADDGGANARRTAAGGPGSSPRRLRHGELTRREVEILELVGQGKSDPEIAEILVISPKTASVHVANIKGKLGLRPRLEVALRARDLGLVLTGRPDAAATATRRSGVAGQQPRARACPPRTGHGATATSPAKRDHGGAGREHRTQAQPGDEDRGAHRSRPASRPRPAC